MNIYSLNKNFKRIVIVGGGFGGIEIVKRIDTKRYETLLIDKNNFFTFQPLLYQVATGGLEPDSVAYPLRKVISDKKNVVFRLAEVQRINISEKYLQANIG